MNEDSVSEPRAPKESGAPGAPGETDRRAARRRVWVLAFFVVAVTAGGLQFVRKLFAFLSTIRKDELAGFAFDPVLIYGVVTAGFLCLLVWAFLTGQFKDVEKAKYEMLERFEEQEAAERRAAEGVRS